MSPTTAQAKMVLKLSERYSNIATRDAGNGIDIYVEADSIARPGRRSAWLMADDGRCVATHYRPALQPKAPDASRSDRGGGTTRRLHTLRMLGDNVTLATYAWLDLLDELRSDSALAGRIRDMLAEDGWPAVS